MPSAGASRSASASKSSNGLGRSVKVEADRARLHLLKAHREHAVCRSGGDRLPREKQRRRSRRAVVVDVHDRNPGHSEAIDRLLTRGRSAEHEARIGLLHRVIPEARVGEREASGCRAHFVIRGARARLGERNHADARDDDLGRHALLRSVSGRERSRVICGCVAVDGDRSDGGRRFPRATRRNK